MDEFVRAAITDKLEGWEIIEFLQVPIGDVLIACLENDWINDENYGDLLEFVGLKRGEE